ncbi:hypothetical protein JTB14_012727 [Gonioctena quinquepunctata]|nr:hypothetical protein JTB14_012727 [Gonioctena quinquepunctata]
MTACLKKDAEIEHTPKFIESFETCKRILTNEPLLRYPDFSRPFNLTTDASNFAIGAILSQGPIGKDKPIAYASRTLIDTEINYSTIEKEIFQAIPLRENLQNSVGPPPTPMSCQLDVDLKHHATPTSTPKSHQRTTTDPSKIQTVPVHPKEEIKPIHLEKIPLDELHKLHDIQDHMTPLFYEQDSDYTHLWTTPVYIAIAASVGISCFKYYHCLPCQKKATMTPPSEPPVLFVPYKTSSGDGEVTK